MGSVLRTRGAGVGCAGSYPNGPIQIVGPCYSAYGSDPAAELKETHMSLASLCMILGLMIAFATLILKVVEMSRPK
jgi:hypothetical protein